MVKFSEKKSMLEKFRANVLKRKAGSDFQELTGQRDKITEN